MIRPSKSIHDVDALGSGEVVPGQFVGNDRSRATQAKPRVRDTARESLPPQAHAHARSIAGDVATRIGIDPFAVLSFQHRSQSDRRGAQRDRMAWIDRRIGQRERMEWLSARTKPVFQSVEDQTDVRMLRSGSGSRQVEREAPRIDYGRSRRERLYGDLGPRQDRTRSTAASERGPEQTWGTASTDGRPIRGRARSDLLTNGINTRTKRCTVATREEGTG